MREDDLLPPEIDPVERRRRAKQWNERLKAFATFLNGMGIALFVAFAITLPGVDGRLTWLNFGLGLLSATVAHIFAQAILTLWKSED